MEQSGVVWSKMKAHHHVRGNCVEFIALLLKILSEFIRWMGFFFFAQHCLVLWDGSRGLHELFKCMTKWNKVCVCLVTQLCLTLCDPMGCSPPGSSVHGILQAWILQWVPFPSPGDFPNPGTEHASPPSAVVQVDSLPLSHLGSPNGTKRSR